MLMFTIITIMFPIPVMVVFAAAVIAIPVAGIETVSVVTGTNPMCPAIWRTSPVPGMPMVAVSHRIPVSVHPYEFRSRTWRENPNHPWRRWWSDLDPNRHLTERE